MLDIIVLVVITILLIGLICYLEQLWKYKSLNSINGPMPYPFIGNALEFGLNPVEQLKDICRIFDKYGPIAKIKIGPIGQYIIMSDPELIEFFMSSMKHIKKSPDYELFRPWLANGLLISTGSYWQKRRKIITPTFHFKILDEFISIFNSDGDILVKRLAKEVGKDAVDIYPFITAYALDIICETAMGTSVNAQEAPNNTYVQAVKDICNMVVERSFSPWKQFDVLFKLSTDFKQSQKSIGILHSFTNAVIEKKRKELSDTGAMIETQQNEDDHGIKKRIAFLDLLLQSTIDDQPLSDDDIREEVNTFLFEGHDTTSSAIAFALYELARNPDIQENAVKELRDIFADDKERKPTINDLNNMKYIELIIKETLRLYPSVPMFGRQLTEDVSHNGVVYPKGVSLIFVPYHMHRRPDLFTNPDQFDPNRFVHTNLQNTFSYVPFSAGPRNCIGQKFAMLELKASISKVLRHFVLLPADPKYNVILSAEVILKSANGVHLRMAKREF